MTKEEFYNFIDVESVFESLAFLRDVPSVQLFRTSKDMWDYLRKESLLNERYGYGKIPDALQYMEENKLSIRDLWKIQLTI